MAAARGLELAAREVLPAREGGRRDDHLRTVEIEDAARLLLDDQAEATRMGQAAHAYVRENYLGDVHLMRYARLLSTLIAGG